MGASRHRCVTIANGACRKTSRERQYVAAQDREHLAELQDQRGVQNILSRRTKMDEAGCLLARYSAEFLDNRGDGISNPARTIGHVIKPDVFRTGGSGDRVRYRAWN